MSSVVPSSGAREPLVPRFSNHPGLFAGVPAGARPEPQVGDTAGRYQLCERIGEGTLATIFRAQVPQTGSFVALKVLRTEFAGQPDAVRRFAREAQVTHRCRHPNLAEIHEVVISSEYPPFLVMELLEGMDLAAFLARRGRLPVDQAIDIACQICDALTAMHARSILHRDLKPANVFLLDPEDGHPIVKVLDFGLSKFLYSGDPYDRSRPGASLGTPEYMPPEQVRGEELDRTADLYALGIILFEMLTGRPLMAAEREEDRLRLALTARAMAPSKALPPEAAAEIPPLLDHVVLRCLQRDPLQRPESAEDVKSFLLAALDAAAPAGPGPAASLDTVPVEAPLPAAPGLDRGWWIAGIGAGLFSVALLLYLALLR
jgi:serine/threonine-protein kinase